MVIYFFLEIRKIVKMVKATFDKFFRCMAHLGFNCNKNICFVTTSKRLSIANTVVFLFHCFYKVIFSFQER